MALNIVFLKKQGGPRNWSWRRANNQDQPKDDGYYPNVRRHSGGHHSSRVGYCDVTLSYLDGVLLDMKLTPYDVELQVPRYYRRERGDKIQKVNDDIDRIIYELENPPPPKEETDETEEEEEYTDKEKKEKKDYSPSKLNVHKKLSEAPEEPASKKKQSANPNWPPRFKKVELTESQKLFKAMILLVQKHERARVARLFTHELKEKKRIQHDIAWHIHKPIPEDIQERSVSLIQRFWRGYVVRHQQWHHRTQGRLLMGELTPSWRAHVEQDAAEAVEEARHKKQRETDEEWTRAQRDLEAAVRSRDDDVKDDIADHLRWFIEDWYRRVGELPAFPEPTKILPDQLLGFPKDTPPDWLKRMVVEVPTAAVYYPGIPPHLIGGSALIVAGYWVDPVLYDLAHTVARLAKNKPGANKEKKKEKLTKQQLKELKEEEKEKKVLEKEKAQKELEEKLKRGVVPNPTDLLEPFSRQLDKARVDWGGYKDLAWNPLQHHREDLPLTELSYERHNELREVVDDLMRLEIERLQDALNRDRGKKKKGGEKKKRKPKPKKGKKDPTGDRTTESLFRELVEKGIIRKTVDTRIDALFCQPSWSNWDLRRDPWWQNPAPNFWDVKQVLKEYCVLPLGSTTVHRQAPLVRSVLLAGYPDCGKRVLVDAITAETGAVLFDLSPPNTRDKYPGKKGLNMLVHLVTKMSRILQPSVILIEGGEKPFYKKVPKPEKADNPKLLKKHLPKMVKAVTAEDQVLFLATADNPWAGQAASIAKTYNKIIPVLPPDQNTAASYWHHRLMRYHSMDRDFLYSPLAWCTRGLTLPAIDKVISTVLTAERTIALSHRPLDPQELLAPLLAEPPVAADQREKLMAWYEATYPLARKRAERSRADAELRDKLAAIEAKKKEQKKGKK